MKKAFTAKTVSTIAPTVALLDSFHSLNPLIVTPRMADVFATQALIPKLIAKICAHEELTTPQKIRRLYLAIKWHPLKSASLVGVNMIDHATPTLGYASECFTEFFSTNRESAPFKVQGLEQRCKLCLFSSIQLAFFNSFFFGKALIDSSID